MENNLNITLDFTGQTPVGAGLGYLTPGIHQARISELKHYEESNRLYVYMITDGIRHRESFNLSEKALPFIMAFLISAGVPEEKLSGKVEFPFHKLVGQPVYFNYTPPTMNAEGQAQDGSYPTYRFYTQAHYEQMVAVMAPTDDTAGAPITSMNGTGGQPVAASTSEDNFDFLLDGGK